MGKLTLLASLSLLLFSCNKKQESWHRVNVNGSFAMDIPGRFERGFDLHDFAPVQFQDEDAETYMIGFTQSKSDLEKIRLKYTLKDYSWFQLRNISSGINTVLDSYSMQSDVNGSKAIFTEISGRAFDGESFVPVHYSAAVIEGSESYYQFVCWGKESEVLSMKDDLHTMYCSFREAGTGSRISGESGAGAASAN